MIVCVGRDSVPPERGGLHEASAPAQAPKDGGLRLDDFEGLPCSVIDLFESVVALITPEGLQASTDARFRDAIIARDSLRIALDLTDALPDLVLHALITLARLQGTRDDERSEEQPGRIPHEFRSAVMGARVVSPKQQEQLRQLARLWRAQDDTVVYYGSADSTPQFLRLLGAAVKLRGEAVLEQRFVHLTGETRTLRDSALAAAEWIVDAAHRSNIGLVEFLRRNPNGHRYQVMRDGVTSYIHGESGELANSDAPIASLEVQGLAYDALCTAADLLGGGDAKAGRHWRALAARLRDAVLEWFWLPEEEAFAMAVDRDADGHPRVVRTLSSNAAELLETTVFDELSQQDRQRFVSAIVNLMYGAEFLTPAGIRTLALRHCTLLPYFDYQGSYTTWPVISNVFATGLRCHGLDALAVDQENRYLNALNTAGELLEFFYVDEHGRVNYDPFAEWTPSEGATTLPGIDLPSRSQGWTISAALRALLGRVRPSAAGRAARFDGRLYRAKLRGRALGSPTPLLRSREEVAAARSRCHPFRIDSVRARALRRAHWSERGVRLYSHDDPVDGYLGSTSGAASA